jgi:hypothetical protein
MDINTINYYEPIYQCLCSNYSEAYLKSSNWYVGDSLHDWWVKIEPDVKSYKKKYKKLNYIKEILNIFINNDY